MELDLNTQNQFDLAFSTEFLLESVKKKYPGLSHGEVESLTSILLGRIGDSISAGHEIGTFRPNANGDIDFCIWDLDSLINGEDGGRS